MTLKLFRAFWFCSVLALFGYLLYGYAGWQQEMIIQDDGSETISTSREVLFYGLVTLFLTVNVLVYLVGRMYPKKEDLRSWFHGLLITLNFFFIIAMNLIGVYNSGESFDFSRVGFMVYGSVALIGLWALAWPLYVLYQKFFIKQVV